MDVLFWRYLIDSSLSDISVSQRNTAQLPSPQRRELTAQQNSQFRSDQFTDLFYPGFFFYLVITNCLSVRCSLCQRRIIIWLKCAPLFCLVQAIKKKKKAFTFNLRYQTSVCPVPPQGWKLWSLLPMGATSCANHCPTISIDCTEVHLPSCQLMCMLGLFVFL